MSGGLRIIAFLAAAILWSAVGFPLILAGMVLLLAPANEHGSNLWAGPIAFAITIAGFVFLFLIFRRRPKGA
jgi:hypothetical protein